MQTTVAMLLWMDAQYPDPRGLAESLGDRYLYAHNPLFRRVRDLALSHGVRFQTGGELDLHYDIAPLLTLPRILESGVVPFVANAAVLQAIFRARPKVKMTLDELQYVKPNYVMHESAHIIADHILRPLNLDPIVRDLLAESFANTVESMGEWSVSHGVHRAMYGVNTYSTPRDDERMALFKALVTEYGFRAVCETAIWCYFGLNLHSQRNHLPEAFARAAADSVRPGQPAALLVSAAPVVFRLNRKFREATTPLYFRFAGLEAEYQQLSDRPLDGPALAALGLPEAARALAEAIGEFDRS